MKYIKKFEKFITEGSEPLVKPKEPGVKPSTRPERPTRPEKTPDRVERPEEDPGPKAKVKSLDVAERFINEINKKGESVKKYL